MICPTLFFSHTPHPLFTDIASLYPHTYGDLQVMIHFFVSVFNPFKKIIDPKKAIVTPNSKIAQMYALLFK